MRQRVFLTGATGTMGRAVAAQLAAGGQCDVVAFVHTRPGRGDQRAASVAALPRVRLAYGDLVDAHSVGRGAAGCDVIVHCGGMVSPAADRVPRQTMDVNTTAMVNIIAAARATGARVVNIGSVAMYGDRPVPIHWGRVGDPLKVSTYDAYAISKIIAEALLIDSGVPWVSLRQTGIITPDFYMLLDPIMYHAPLAEVLEWITPEASARAVAGVCSPDFPAHAWGRAYNLGGGPGWRVTNAQFVTDMLGALGARNPQAWVRPHWFATRNFHGMWFADSGDLQGLIGFQEGGLGQAIADAAATAPRTAKLARWCPAWLARAAVMWPLARRPPGPLSWLAAGDTARIEAYFGSEQEWKALPRRAAASDAVARLSPPRQLDHGYDESVPPQRWDRALVQGAAAFRGGELESFAGARERAAWRCAAGHHFRRSPLAVLHAGHWCLRCVMETWAYPRLAQVSQFFAQVWPPFPGPDGGHGDMDISLA